MKPILFAGVATAVLLIAGCQFVHVTDQQGKPIGWADVTATTQESGATGIPVKTDLITGVATLPMSQEAPNAREWLEIRKEGYFPKHVVRPENADVTVELLKVPTNKQNAQTNQATQ